MRPSVVAAVSAGTVDPRRGPGRRRGWGTPTGRRFPRPGVRSVTKLAAMEQHSATTTVDVVADVELDDLLEDELLVEEISIDGMCGVY